jgi:predicted permease
MRAIRAFLLRLRGLFSNEHRDRELSEELDFHLDMRIQDNIRFGMAPAEARRAALLESGGLESAKEVYRDRRGLPGLESLFQDVRYALRTLRKSPGFTMTALLILAVGIGANTAIFSTINAVLLRALPYGNPAQLVMLWADDPKRNIHQEGVSYPNFEDWRRINHSFEDMAFFSRHVSATLTSGQEPEQVEVAVVSSNFFSVLGVQPSIGRTFSAQETREGDRVIVISHRLWMRRFGAAPSAVGNALEVDGIPWRIIGVMPASFQFPNPEVPFWEQLTSFRAWHGIERERYSDWGRVIGRLKPHVTLELAQADMRVIGTRLERAYPPPAAEAASFAGFAVNLVPLTTQITGTQLPLALWVLMGAVLAVLLIACLNVTNLLLARGAARSREIAIRQALGAARRRIVQQMLTESLLLSGVGGVLGVGLATIGIRILISRGARSVPRLDEVRIDPSVLVFTLGISMLACLVCGLTPAIRLSHNGSALGQRNANTGHSGAGIRGVLVILEVALSVILLSAAGLLIHSFLRVQSVDVGFRPEQVLTMRIASSRDGAANVAFYDELLELVHSLPDVRSVGMVEDVLQRRNPDFAITIANRVRQPTEPISGDAISAGYFDAMGVRLLRGRLFSKRDAAASEKVAIINNTMAQHLWPSDDPVGKQFRPADAPTTDPWTSVVGVVSDMRRQELERAPIAQMFWPHAQRPVETMDLVVRSASDPTRLASVLREQVRAIDKHAAVFQISTLESRLQESLAPRRFQSELVGLLSTIALSLAAFGLYTVMYYSVTLRTTEIGIRMALGARAIQVVGMVIRQGLTLTAFGLIAGQVVALSLTRLLSTLLFGVTPTDPATLITVIALIGTVAVMACCVPAWRAATIDPLLALRDE